MRVGCNRRRLTLDLIPYQYVFLCINRVLMPMGFNGTIPIHILKTEIRFSRVYEYTKSSAVFNHLLLFDVTPPS